MIKELAAAYEPILTKLIDKCLSKASELESDAGEFYGRTAEWMMPTLKLHAVLADATGAIELAESDPLLGAIRTVPYSEVPVTRLGGANNVGGKRIIEPWMFREALIASAQEAFNEYIDARVNEAYMGRTRQRRIKVTFRSEVSVREVPDYLFSEYLDDVMRLTRRREFERAELSPALDGVPVVHTMRDSTVMYRRRNWAMARLAGEGQLRADVIADAIERRVPT